VPFKSVKLKKRIAEGSFGTVWKARWYNIFVAAKVVREDYARSEAVTQNFLAEIQLTRYLTSLRLLNVGLPQSALIPRLLLCTC
jgi:serine/threonine protein kinase